MRQTIKTMNRAVECGLEKGASSCWLKSVPITEHRFALHKSAF